MNGGHGARAHDADGRKRSIAHLVRADVPEPFSRTLRERARRYATTPQHLATTEADPFSLLEKLANRRPRRVVDNRTLGEVDRDTGLRASPPELLVSAGLEMFGEATYGVEDSPPHEQIRSRGKALLHVVTLAKEPAGVNNLGERRSGRKLRLDSTCRSRSVGERDQAALEPIRMRATIRVCECQVLASRHLHPLIACSV